MLERENIPKQIMHSVSYPLIIIIQLWRKLPLVTLQPWKRAAENLLCGHSKKRAVPFLHRKFIKPKQNKSLKVKIISWEVSASNKGNIKVLESFASEQLFKEWLQFRKENVVSGRLDEFVNVSTVSFQLCEKWVFSLNMFHFLMIH